MLDGAPVLIVEDEVRIALELAREIEAANGEVVGPFSSVATSLAYLARADVAAAILDANLIDRDVTPVALQLVDRGVPFIIHTGVGLPAELRQLHPDLPVFTKPIEGKRLVEALAALI